MTRVGMRECPPRVGAEAGVDEFLVLACDGIWEVMESQGAIRQGWAAPSRCCVCV